MSCKLRGGASILDFSVHYIPYIPSAFDLGNLVVDRSHCLDFDQSAAVQPHMQQTAMHCDTFLSREIRDSRYFYSSHTQLYRI